jgi:hypothetical protein
MKIDPDECRDPDLLAAEVRRLKAVIAAGEPALTAEEREAVLFFASIDSNDATLDGYAATLRKLLERLETDIVERLRAWCHRPDHLSIKDLLDEAARSVIDWRLEAEVHRKRAAAAVAEIARLRLTAAEREAIEWCLSLPMLHRDVVRMMPLRSILERMR